ncbi:gamma-glutamyl-gamma-aminobutyrate hydrolase family protein [Actinacidiphila rubida]|uniref:Anthranilate synthase component 2/putative glutamine amidotransferase n=1 Tax=Actinacidiphila rubida TaxID=310780 RepID=A0A1H8EBD7_9ACTN|nr:gamma-glutamyl-gamma-aminobutyrate hydrolase family protein [Actinacidiphila rubida]SEN16078.1 anthranilate synthase component 2/putative glutamine amidotransferase [Actinacidiphila rubida]
MNASPASPAAPVPGPRPVVGISCYTDDAAWGVWEQRAALLPQGYVDGVTRAGGAAVLLPPQPETDSAARIVAGLDALVLAGGPDIDPARYGASPHPRTGPPHPERDAWELALARAALDRDVPVLGVCRGLQLLNVACGGTLRQHLPEGSHQRVPARFVRRTVRVRPGTRLAGVLGAGAEVSCYHHQAVDRLGAGLLPTAWADDGTVEAAEADASLGHRHVLGVQWHPETDLTDLRLFASLVTAARKETAV